MFETIFMWIFVIVLFLVVKEPQEIIADGIELAEKRKLTHQATLTNDQS